MHWRHDLNQASGVLRGDLLKLICEFCFFICFWIEHDWSSVWLCIIIYRFNAMQSMSSFDGLRYITRGSLVFILAWSLKVIKLYKLNAHSFWAMLPFLCAFFQMQNHVFILTLIFMAFAGVFCYRYLAYFFAVVFLMYTVLFQQNTSETRASVRGYGTSQS